ncbi:calmodulin-like protein 3 [Salvia miltiorrhiza]|uniref:calmodulin-like protein 3 n=1 Tax=Salvia miltiorrhiza TaxID=226208 RepID=UPI0025AC99B7|nr:calmodulin-like protein 3 [Salvia miltiorrhiza]
MITVLLYSLLFVFALIYTLISPTKKFLAPWLESFRDRKTLPPQDSIKPAAASAPPAAIGGLRGVFATFDKNNDGFITKQELRESLQNIGILAGEKDVEDMVEKVDFNGDGLIDFDEFCKLYESMGGAAEVGGGGDGDGDGDGDLREAFDVFDGNKDGRITVEELGLVLSSLGFSEGKKIEDCKEMIRKVDVDGDGMVDFDEFKKMMRDGLGRLIAVS